MDVPDHVDMDKAPNAGMESTGDIEMASSDAEMDDLKHEVKDDKEMDLTPDTTRDPAVTFMDLPKSVRKKIYKYARLLRNCTISITNERSRTKGDDEDHALCLGYYDEPSTNIVNGWQSTHGASVCDHPRLPLNLFLVSRAVQEDAAITFYSEHRFKISLRNQMDLLTFLCATERYLQYIRVLHVELHPYDYRSLKLAPGTHRSILNLWDKFCRIVPRRMTRLRAFSLKTRVKDADTAQKVVDTMEGHFPLLNECAIYFDYAPNDNIREVGRRAVWDRMSTIDPLDQPFRFRDLPKEIQLMILRYVLTVHWDPHVGNRKRASAGYVTFQDRKRQRSPDIFPLICCDECSEARMYCFCYPRQSAVSSHCVCFRSPISYFLVDREMYVNARDIFYSKNRFAFVEEDPEFMMRFFHHFPNSTLRMIRHLTFKFPSIFRLPNKPTSRSERTMQINWSILLRFIKEHFDLAKLTVVVADHGTMQSLPTAVDDRNRYMRRFLKLFTELRGVHSFQVYLVDDPAYEEIAERAVMGPRYDPRKKDEIIPFYGPRPPPRQQTQF